MASKWHLEPPYTFTDANPIYYGDGSSDFTVTALMADTLSKLDTVTFPDTTIAGYSYDTPNGLETASESHLYTFDSSNSEAGPYDVLVTDRAGNSTPATFELVNDEVGPTVLIDVPPTSGLGVPVSWEGLDLGAGLRHYEVQVKEAGGDWTAWLSDVSYNQATYIGGAGKSYTFQIKATDNVNNESAWIESGSVSVEAVTKYYTFGGQKVAMRRGSEVYYLGGDHLGSTSLTTDSSGGVVSEVRYLPYGQVRWSNGTSVTDFGFTSQRNEASFGLMDYNARYYSPVLGRFVSPDTIVPDPSSSGGFNRYRYTRNNPLRYTDPSGHQGGCPKQDAVCESVEYIREMGEELIEATELFMNESERRVNQVSELANDLIGNGSIPVGTVKPSIVQHGQSTPTSLEYEEAAFMADTIDFGITSTIAMVGLGGGAISGGTVAGYAELANLAARPITLPAGTAGWIFNITSDLTSGQTDFSELSNGSIYIGTDSIVSTLTFIGGDVNPELYTSSIADAIQYSWDIARKEGQESTSFKLEFSYSYTPTP